MFAWLKGLNLFIKTKPYERAMEALMDAHPAIELSDEKRAEYMAFFQALKEDYEQKMDTDPLFAKREKKKARIADVYARIDHAWDKLEKSVP